MLLWQAIQTLPRTFHIELHETSGRGQFHHSRKRLLPGRDGHGAASRYEEPHQPADVGEMSGAGPINVAFALAANLVGQATSTQRCSSDDDVAVRSAPRRSGLIFSPSRTVLAEGSGTRPRCSVGAYRGGLASFAFRASGSPRQARRRWFSRAGLRSKW